MVVARLETLGRWVMIDFGFSGFLEKIEEYFGPQYARALAFIVGMTVVTAGLGLVGGYLLL